MKLLRLALFGGSLLFASSLLALDRPDYLVRVSRETADDRARLLAERTPLVFETSASLFAEVTADELRRLERSGRSVSVIDRDPWGAEYFAIGLRPDSDRWMVESIGKVLFEEENWVLLRTSAKTDPALLHDARVFVGRVGHEPLRPAVHPEPSGEAVAPAPRVALPLVQEMVASTKTTDIDTLWSAVTVNSPTGSRYSNGTGCSDAATAARNQLDQWGLDTEQQSWSTSSAPNTYGTRLGERNPGRVYIVVAHLDDLPSSGTAPGADDNASGSVTVLESAKVLSCYGFRNTVRFLLVTGEEQGLLGSEAYAAAAAARGEDIRGVINMDMNGWAGNAVAPAVENLDLNYDANSQSLAQHFAACATEYSTGLAVDAFLCPSLTASDHAPFWDHGWKAICGITDNEGYCSHAGNYPYYHQSTDTIAACGAKAFFYSTVKTTVAALAVLGEPFRIAFDRDAVGCGGSIGVVVAERDLNQNPSVAETLTISVSSGSETTPETVVLTEAGTDSMFFRGTVVTTAGPAVHGDGLLSTSAGDVVTALYVDALDCAGAVGTSLVATANTDCVLPTISNVAVGGISDSTATITWTTSEPADSRVAYGVSTPGTTVENLADLVTSHSVTLSGLASCTNYVFRVGSADAAGNLVTADAGGALFTFRTNGRAYAFGPENVEGSTANWTATGQWHVDTCRAASGTKSWKAGANSVACNVEYTASTDSYLTSATVVLGSAGHGYRLRWKEWWASESGYDWCTPQISVNGGAGWSDLLTHYAGSSGGWLSKEVDLAPWSGSTVKIRFWFHADSGTNGEGWYVDDVDIGRTMPCNAELSIGAVGTTDSCSGTGGGAGNGVADPGEDVALSVTLSNPSNLAGQGATAVSALLVSETPGVVVTRALGSFPNIAAGATGGSLAPHFSIRVGSGVSCATVMTFRLEISAAEGSWTKRFTKMVGTQTPAGGNLLTEGFESATFPPSGWSQGDVSGTAGNWARSATTVHPYGVAPHGGSGLAYFNSYSATSGSSTRLFPTSGITIPAGAISATLSFWMYHESGYASASDQIGVQISTSAGSTWTDVGTAIPRYSTTNGWQRHELDLSAWKGVADLRIALLGTSAYGNDCHVDDLSVDWIGTPSCSMSACSPAPQATPREASPSGSPLRASAATGGNEIALSFAPACGATSHAIYWRSGALSAPLAWNGVVCNVSTSFAPPTTPDGGLLSFVVVGQSTIEEGSYGRDSTNAERPEGSGFGACDRPQSFAGSCP
jgi:hypothetical protein